MVTHPIQHFAPLYREVARAGEIELRVFFCCDWGVRAYFDALYDREIEWDVPLLEGYAHEFLPAARRPRRISFFEVDNPVVAERLAAFSPEALLIHGYGCRTMWRAARWASGKGVPTLLSSDSHSGASEALWKRPIKELVVGRFYSRLAGALAIGDNNRAYHQRFGLPPERIFPAVLPVDGERLLTSVPDAGAARSRIREALGIPAAVPVALFCGNLTPWKRPADFVAAVEQAGPGLWGIVVGDGPERTRIEALAGSGSGRVRLAGFVNQSVIGSYFAASDMLVVPSERDAHPLVVTEALFFGLPILLSDAVGCAGETDTAQVGRNARRFAVGDTAALAALLIELATEPAVRARMSEASRAIAPEHDARRAAELLAEAVRSVLRLGPRAAKGRGGNL